MGGALTKAWCNTGANKDWASCKSYCAKLHVENQVDNAKTHAENTVNDAKDTANGHVDSAKNSVNDAKNEAARQADVARCMGFEKKCSGESSVARGKCATVADDV